MNTARTYEYFTNFHILFSDLYCRLHDKFCHLGSNQILLFKISCITTSSFSTVQAGCVEAGKIIEEDYNHSHGISTRITEGMNYSLYRLSHGIITYFARILATLLIMAYQLPQFPLKIIYYNTIILNLVVHHFPFVFAWGAQNFRLVLEI